MKAMEGLRGGDGGGVMDESAVDKVGKPLRIRSGEGLRTLRSGDVSTDKGEEGTFG